MTAQATEPSVWDVVGDTLGERLADDLRALVREADAGADRSQQRHLGPSQIGMPCTRCLARHVLGVPVERTFNDPWCAVIGTATHDWLEVAAAKWNVNHTPDGAQSRWWPERQVQPHPDLLPSGGKADLYDHDTATVIDHKIVGDAAHKRYKLSGPGTQYRVQAHLYGLGYHRLGKTVRNVAVAFWKRGGRLSDLYVWTEPYDVDIAMGALMRYRLIQEQCAALGSAVIPLLPADSSCWDCEGRDDLETPLVPPMAPAVAPTQPNPAPSGHERNPA